MGNKSRFVKCRLFKFWITRSWLYVTAGKGNYVEKVGVQVTTVHLL